MGSTSLNYLWKLPKELFQQIIIYAGLLKEPFEKVLHLEEEYPYYLDKSFWKLYCQNRFPHLRIFATPPKELSEKEERHFWKKLIHEVHKAPLNSIEKKPMKELYFAIIKNDFANVNRILNNQPVSIDDLNTFDIGAQTKDFIIPKLSLTSLAVFLRRKEILTMFYLKAKNEHKNQDFWYACAFGQIDTLEHSTGMNSCDNPVVNDKPPIWVACEQNHAAVVKLLLRKGANINKPASDDGSTPLYIASQNGHEPIVSLLLKKGADINKATSNHGTTPLFIASQNGHDRIVNLLLQKGADINKASIQAGATPLLIASQKGHAPVVNLLLNKGADVNKETIDDGTTPLYIACQNGHTPVVNLLLKKEVNVNKETTDEGTTPLYIACQNGHLNIVKQLLKNRADINKGRTSDGATPLFIASKKGHDKIVGLLLNKEVKVNLTCSNDNASPLYTACKNGHLNVVKLLLKKGADVNIKCTVDGATPLKIAKKFNHSKIVRLLEVLDGHLLTEENLIKLFRIYSKGCIFNLGLFKNKKHFDSIVRQAFNVLNSKEENLETFLTVLKTMAERNDVDLKAQKKDDLYTLIELYEIVSGTSFNKIPVNKIMKPDIVNYKC